VYGIDDSLPFIVNILFAQVSQTYQKKEDESRKKG
jgi:hypothetical protein